MAEDAACEAWDHTAALMTTIHNVQCAKSSDMISDQMTLNPIRVARRDRAQAKDDGAGAFAMMTDVFLKRPDQWQVSAEQSRQGPLTSASSPTTLASSPG